MPSVHSLYSLCTFPTINRKLFYIASHDDSVGTSRVLPVLAAGLDFGKDDDLQQHSHTSAENVLLPHIVRRNEINL